MQTKKIYPKSATKESFIHVINKLYDEPELDLLDKLISMRTVCLLSNIDASSFMKIKTNNIVEIVKKDIDFLTKLNLLDLHDFKSYIISYFDYLKPLYKKQEDVEIVEKLIDTAKENKFPIGRNKNVGYLLNVQMLYTIKNPDFTNLKEVETIYNNWVKNNKVKQNINQ